MLKLPAHTRYDYSCIDERPKYDWPGGKRLAFYVALNIEHFAFGTGIGMDPTNRGGPQTQRNWAWRDYGNRVGIWRLFRMLDDLELPATILLNSTVCDHYPQIVQRIKVRGDDVVGHGRTNAEASGRLWEPDEARLIADCNETIAAHFGDQPRGWMGPAASESSVTPDLLKEAGYTYLLDWPLDDQPVWMRTRAGPILSVPYPLEQNDAGHQILRDQSGREFADMVVDQFELMVEECVERPLVFSLSLHGFIAGQPFRMRPLQTAMEHCVRHPRADRVWWTRARDIAEYCFTLPPGIVPGS